MLLVLIGADRNITKGVETILTSLNFSTFIKRVYNGETSSWNNRTEKVEISKEELEQTDFVYESFGRYIGFNKNDLFDAVNEKCDKWLTLSTPDSTIAREIKATYGLHARIIYFYNNDVIYKEALNNLQNIEEAEFNKRMHMMQEIKKSYYDNIDLFDDIILFDKSDKEEIGYRHLEDQIKSIIDKARKELERLDNNSIELPYIGNEDYVFVSYSHKDNEVVEKLLKELSNSKIRIWYDKGLSGGVNWRAMVQNKIDHSKIVLYFSSKDANTSKHVNAEINYALDIDKDILRVKIDDTPLAAGIEMYLKSLEYIEISSPTCKDKIIEALPDAVKAK